MATIAESDLPGAKAANRVVVGIIAVVALSIAISLGALIALLISRTGLRPDPTSGAMLSLIASFVVFFGAIAVLATSFVLKPRSELMSIKGWRLLSGTLTILGIASALAYHWVALLPWLAMGLLCLLKDPKVLAWLTELGV